MFGSSLSGVLPNFICSKDNHSIVCRTQQNVSIRGGSDGSIGVRVDTS